MHARLALLWNYTVISDCTFKCYILNQAVAKVMVIYLLDVVESVNADCCVPHSVVVPMTLTMPYEAECHGICLQSMLLEKLRQENHLNSCSRATCVKASNE